MAALKVRANPELKGVVATGANTLPQVVVEEAFRDQYGRTLNFRAFKDSLGKVNRWYEERGIFGQVQTRCKTFLTQSRIGGITRPLSSSSTAPHRLVAAVTCQHALSPAMLHHPAVQGILYADSTPVGGRL